MSLKFGQFIASNLPPEALPLFVALVERAELTQHIYAGELPQDPNAVTIPHLHRAVQ